MRRVRFYEYGGPEVLRIEDAEAPRPGPGELLVRTEAIGVTLPSVRKVRGEDGRAPLPGVLGGEVAGTVIALGPEVADFQVGDRVTSLTFSGSYSELAIPPASWRAAYRTERAPSRPSRWCVVDTSPSPPSPRLAPT